MAAAFRGGTACATMDPFARAHSLLGIRRQLSETVAVPQRGLMRATCLDRVLLCLMRSLAASPHSSEGSTLAEGFGFSISRLTPSTLSLCGFDAERLTTPSGCGNVFAPCFCLALELVLVCVGMCRWYCTRRHCLRFLLLLYSMSLSLCAVSWSYAGPIQ